MSKIKLTVPLDYNALTRASDMLRGLALDIRTDTVEVITCDTEAEAESLTNRRYESAVISGKDKVALGTDDEIPGMTDAAEVFTPPATTAGETDTQQAGSRSQSTTTQTATDTPANIAAELDTAGIPWDERIHGGAKLKLAKTGAWKKRRNVDPALVTEVEAELRQLMAIPAATAEETPPPPPPLPNDTDGIASLPELMAAATGAGKTPEEMSAAALKCGLTSIALLGARPDLIPTVAVELGL